MRKTLLTTLTCWLTLTTLAGAQSWQWPLDGRVVGHFKYDRATPFAAGQRRGIVIAARPGETVRAVCSGPVRFAGSVGNSGRVVSVGCGSLSASYLHLDSIGVHRGDGVYAGQTLGTAGVGGLYLGAKEVGSRFEYVDPLTLLKGVERTPPVGAVPARRGLPRGGAPLTAPAAAPLFAHGRHFALRASALAGAHPRLDILALEIGAVLLTFALAYRVARRCGRRWSARIKRGGSPIQLGWRVLLTRNLND